MDIRDDKQYIDEDSRHDKQEAIDTVLRATMIDRGMKTFNLLGVGGVSNPTYDDWFLRNPDLGDALKKMDDAEDINVAWNEFNLKLFSSLLEHCHLSYASSSTSKTKYRKLKELVKSLSSYLVNYIDNASNTSTGVELSHLKQDALALKMSFTSYVDFDPVCQTFNYVQIGDLEGDIYLPASEATAKEGVEYYVYRLTTSGRDDTYTYVRDYPNPGDAFYNGEQRYFKVNFHELLNVNATMLNMFMSSYTYRNASDSERAALLKKYNAAENKFRVWKVGDKWVYQLGSLSSLKIETETYPADDNVTSTEEGTLTEVAQSMLGVTKDASIAKYFKQEDCTAVIWETRNL